MTYVKQTWANGVAGGTPISAARLNHMEDGIEAATFLLDPATLTKTSLDAALAAADAAGGGKVSVGDGSATFTTTVGFSLGSNVHLELSDNTVFTFTNLAANAACVQAIGKTNPKVTGGTLKHSPATNGNQHGVLFQNCVGFVAENVKVVDADRGIWCTSTTDYTVNTGGRISNCSTSNSHGYGFFFERCSNTLVEGCTAAGARSQDGFKTGLQCRQMRFDSCHGNNNTRDGFDFMDGIIESTVVGCTAENNTLEGFDIKGSAGGATQTVNNYVVRQTSFSGCVARNNLDANWHLTDLRGMSFSGCHGIGGGNVGWQLFNIEHCTFTGCHADLNEEHGWRFSQNVKHCSFVACTGNDNATVTAGGSGWYVQTSATGSSDDNMFVACEASRSLQRTVTGAATIALGDKTVEVAGGAFTNDDIGKALQLPAVPWTATIQVINSATSVEIEAAIPLTYAGSLTGLTAIIGDPQIGNQDHGFTFVQDRCYRNWFIGGLAKNNITNNMNVSGTAWTDNQFVSYTNTAGTRGASLDSAGKVLAKLGMIIASGGLDCTGTLTLRSGLIITTLTQSRVLYAGAGGAVDSDANMAFDGTNKIFTGKTMRVLSTTGPTWNGGTGTPEGVVTAPVGSFFSRTDGGAGTSFYVKETGAGNTGWVAK